MSQNPGVLAFHFALELAALAALVYWGWSRHDGAVRWLLVVGLPLAAAVAWAVLRAPEDGPAATVAIPPIARLLLEWTILGGASFLLWQAGHPTLAAVFLACIVLDYVLQYDRVARLLGV